MWLPYDGMPRAKNLKETYNNFYEEEINPVLVPLVENGFNLVS